MRIRLIRKLAEMIDGVNLAGLRVGDVIDLPARQGQLLIAHGWGIAEPEVHTAPTTPFVVRPWSRRRDTAEPDSTRLPPEWRRLLRHRDARERRSARGGG